MTPEVPPLEVGVVAFAYPLALFAGLLLGLAFLVEVVAPALLVLVRAFAPRLVYAASFAATWLVVLATTHHCAPWCRCRRAIEGRAPR